jgi:hypothetical protein
MATTRTRTKARRRGPRFAFVSKPRGTIHPRVQAVGPEHFGLACFDCAKARSKWLLADFYGNILIPPTPVAHTRPALQLALAQLRDANARAIPGRSGPESLSLPER